MPNWDVFHSDRLEAERSLTSEAVRAALARGDLNEDDLVRPSGEARWVRLGDSPEFAAFATPPPTGPEDEDDSAEDEPFPTLDPELLARIEGEPPPNPTPARASDFEVFVEEDEPRPSAHPARPVLPDDQAQEPDLPEIVDLDDEAEFDVFVEDEEGPHAEEEPEFDPQDEDDEATEFTLSRNAPEKVEELDLAAMVDVAFQLVLFFLVTAQVVLYKTLEVPKPNEDKPPEAAAQSRSKTIDELKDDFILVEVDAAGAIKIDRQPVPADRPTLVEKLRKTREDTQRKAMLLSADSATRHENAVLVLDVANEIDLKVALAYQVSKK